MLGLIADLVFVPEAILARPARIEVEAGHGKEEILVERRTNCCHKLRRAGRAEQKSQVFGVVAVVLGVVEVMQIVGLRTDRRIVAARILPPLRQHALTDLAQALCRSRVE